MKKSLALVVFIIVICFCTTGISADDTRLNITDAAVQNAAHVYPYMQHTIYTIYCRPDRFVSIELQPGEKFIYTGGADTVRWIIDPILLGSGNMEQWHVNVKPITDDKTLSTNFMIGTNLHVYHIEAYVSAQNYTPIICWNYPREESAALLLAQQQQQQKEENSILLGVSLSEVNFNYKIYGKLSNSKPSYNWTPELIFDDGKKTYIKMPEEMDSREAPVLFVKDEEKLAIVNYRVKNSYFIVDRLMDKAEMRNGKEVVRIIRKK